MSIKVSEINYKTFGKCIQITNGEVEIALSIDRGPRVIKFQFAGGKNVLNNDETNENLTEDPSFFEHYYEGANWNNFGGHRLWVSPEKLPDTYFPDIHPVEVEILEDGAIFTQVPQTQNGVQTKFEVRMKDCGKVSIEHFVTNISNSQKRCSPWAITVLDEGGIEIIPNNTLDTGLLPNRRIIAWPYTNLADDRLYLGKKYITLKQEPTSTQSFKLGLDNHAGEAYYVLGDTVFYKQYNHDKDGEYDDFGVSFETYTNDKIMEMETLGTVAYLEPNQTASHIEYWSLLKTDKTFDARCDEQIDEFISSLK